MALIIDLWLDFEQPIAAYDIQPVHIWVAGIAYFFHDGDCALVY